jgi:hypothetical protein
MRLEKTHFDNIIYLLDSAVPASDSEVNKLKETAPGVYKNKDYIKSPFKIGNYSLDNIELKEYVSNLFNQNPDKITTIHRLKYFEGGATIPHLDRATYTFVLILDSDLKEGGEFYLKGKYRPDFKETRDYLVYNGGTDIHEVKEVKKGYRDVLVIWWFDETPKQTSLI